MSGAGSPCGQAMGPRRRHDQMPGQPLVQQAHRIPHLGTHRSARSGYCRKCSRRQVPVTWPTTLRVIMMGQLVMHSAPGGLPGRRSPSLPSSRHCRGRRMEAAPLVRPVGGRSIRGMWPGCAALPARGCSRVGPVVGRSSLQACARWWRWVRRRWRCRGIRRAGSRLRGCAAGCSGSTCGCRSRRRLAG